MKSIPSMLFVAFLLCYPALNAQAKGLTADDRTFLQDQCGFDQTDVNVIPNLAAAGQAKLMPLLHSTERDCDAFAAFRATRDYLRKFQPPPNASPLPPRGYDRDFLTTSEAAYVKTTNQSLMDSIVGWFQGK